MGRRRKFVVLHLLLLMLLAAASCLLTGCGPSGREILQAGLDRGESLLIFPQPRNRVEWSGAGGRYDAWQRGDNASAFQVVELGEKYAAVSVPPGEYRISALFSRVEADGRELPGQSSFESRFGQVRVEKTPRKKYVREMVWIPPEYEWVSTGDGHGYYVEAWPGYWEMRTAVKYLASYLATGIELASASGGISELASFGVGPGETVLLPAIWGELGLTDRSCRFVGDEAPPGYQELAGTYTGYTSGGSESDFYNQVYMCPVESLSVVIIPADTADMRQWVDADDLPPGAVERGINLPEIKYGQILQEPHQSRPARFEETHFFSRDTVWLGTAHIFPGRSGSGDGKAGDASGASGENMRPELPPVPE